MRFRYNQTIERTICPKTVAVENSPAWLIICLIKSLNDWLGLPHRVFYRHGDRQLKIGYKVLSFPTDELAENFGSLVSKTDQTWPLEVFGIADSGELIGISFAGDGDSLVMRQQSVSGVWFDELRDLYLTLLLPDIKAARCLFDLLRAVEDGRPAAAMEWEYADFLEQQHLACIDRTLSFCYVYFEQDCPDDAPLACLLSLTLEQKQKLWLLFLEKRIFPPEFEWLWDTLVNQCAPNWIDHRHHRQADCGSRHLRHRHDAVADRISRKGYRPEGRDQSLHHDFTDMKNSVFNTIGHTYTQNIAYHNWMRREIRINSTPAGI